ncbi:response regulator [Sporanaerobium hydrogeniformans]|uniref:response regulator n=1 Tax=Sporanaerobium hydrogeniformans TaxID=3072179 RepID=UPI0015D4AEB1|nr:response regulator [Sporanaerobium hydrogeniformans]
MYQVMIVDDETIVRTTLHTLVDWKNQGFEIRGEAQNGKQALELLETLAVDLLITDIKMPILDGIKLIKKAKEKNPELLIVVLSSYDEFYLVREAFKLGIHDYLLKSTISSESMNYLLGKTKKILLEQKVKRAALEPECYVQKEEQLRNLALGREEGKQFLTETAYYLALFEINDYQGVLERFKSDLENHLMKPMMSCAQQIPRVVSKCVVTYLTPARYVLYYKNTHEKHEEGREEVKSICRQLSSVWKNYMNIHVSAGLSALGKEKIHFANCLKEAEQMLNLKHLKGKEQLICFEEEKFLNFEEMKEAKEKWQTLITAIKQSDIASFQVGVDQLREKLLKLSIEKAQKECLYIIYHIALTLEEQNLALEEVYQKGMDYIERITKKETLKELEIWMMNYLRWLQDYMEHHYDRKQADIIERAKRFIWENYSTPEIS